MNLFINPLHKLYRYMYHYLPYPYPLVIGVNYKPTQSSRGPDLQHIPGNSNSKPCPIRMRNSSGAFLFEKTPSFACDCEKTDVFLLLLFWGVPPAALRRFWWAVQQWLCGSLGCSCLVGNVRGNSGLFHGWIWAKHWEMHFPYNAMYECNVM